MAKTVRVVRKRSSLKRRRALIGKKSKVVKRSGSRRRVKLMKGGDGGDILLIIDPQNDFTDIEQTFGKKIYLPGNSPQENKNTFFLFETSDSKGLPVIGAQADLDRLVNLINRKKFKEIHVSLDSHTKNHIGHIGFWTPDVAPTDYNMDTRPRPLEVFSVESNINTEDSYTEDPVDLYKKFPIKVGTDKRFAYAKYPSWQQFAYNYIKMMQDKKAQDETLPAPCLWAEHCIKGEDGWKVYENLGKALESTKGKGTKVFYHEKGTNDFVEMYSIFSAEIPFDDVINVTKVQNPPLDLEDLVGGFFDATLPKASEILNERNPIQNYATGFNEELFRNLMSNGNKVYVCGEAKSHCVKTSLQDMVKNCTEEMPASNIYVITDCTSSIGGFEEPTNIAFNELKEKGVNLIESETIM